MKKSPVSKKVTVASKRVANTKQTTKKAPAKKVNFGEGGTTYVKANSETVAMLKGFYHDVAIKVTRLNARKKKPEQSQLMSEFNKIAERWAIEIDKLLGKENVIKFSFKLPDIKKSDFKKVSAKKK